MRELLRDAPEAERAACAKALRSFLRGPEFFMPAPVMLGPDQFIQFMRSGWQDKPLPDIGPRIAGRYQP